MYNMFKDKLHNCPLTNLNKYLHNDRSETEVNINISVKDGSKKFKKICDYQ